MLSNHIYEPSCGTKEMVQNQSQQRSNVHLVDGSLEVDPELSQSLFQFLRIFSENLLPRRRIVSFLSPLSEQTR